jgi:CHAD domain-containing protein
MASTREKPRDYELHDGEDAAAAVRRMARGQIDLAAGQLDGSAGVGTDEAVHEARKAFKRLRALVRLSRDAVGDATYRRENTALRDAGRRLSGVRDAAVMVQTLDDVRERYADELPAGAFAGLRSALEREAGESRARLAVDSTPVDEVIAALRTRRNATARWPLPDEADEAMLAPGLQRIYRRGRKALRAARKDTDTEHLHELRKRAKDLWHAAQVLRPVAPKRMRKLAKRAHALSDVVGDDHDLAVLLEGARERPGTLDAVELERLEELVARRRAKLQRRAIKRARRVYARKPAKMGAPDAQA